MNKIINPIPYDKLEPEVRAHLDRYIDKITKATGEHWEIRQIYKPTTWYRALLASREGSIRGVWYRSSRGIWSK